MRALVTGATGVVGTHLVAALRQRGDEVVTVRALEDTAAAAAGCDVAFHLAARSALGDVAADPAGAFAVNVGGTATVLDACRAAGVERVVVASSAQVYGRQPGPWTEDLPLRPANPYAASKAAAELLARSYGDSFGLAVSVARLGNVYGPGDRQRSRLVPELLAGIAEGRAPQLRSDGSPQRDFLHAADAAAALLLLPPGTFNVGGASHTVREVVGVLLDGTGLQASFGEQTEPPRPVLDSGRLHALGWAPRLGLAEGLAGLR